MNIALRYRRSIAIVVAIYLTLAIRWYPGWTHTTYYGRHPPTVSGIHFVDPALIMTEGFELREAISDSPVEMRFVMPMWGLFLAPVVWIVLYSILLKVVPPALVFLGRSCRIAFSCRRDDIQIGLRVLVTLAVLVHLYGILSRIGSQRADPSTVVSSDGGRLVESAVVLGLLPLTLPIYLIQEYGIAAIQRAVWYVMNPLPFFRTNVSTRNLYFDPSVPWFKRYSDGDYHSIEWTSFDGVAEELFRFGLLVILGIVLVRYLTPLAERWPRTARFIVWSLCASLATVSFIGFIDPSFLR